MDKANNLDHLMERVQKAFEFMAMPEFPIDPKNHPPCTVQDFESGIGYIQHHPGAVNECKTRLAEVTAPYITAYSRLSGIQKKYPASIHTGWWVDQVTPLADHEARPLKQAWYRLACIDDSGREWGDPFYAENPPTDTARFICLKDYRDAYQAGLDLANKPSGKGIPKAKPTPKAKHARVVPDVTTKRPKRAMAFDKDGE